MASGGKRGGAGERVLESRHVIGLFMLMVLFFGVFFPFGYLMGRKEYDGSVRAATDFFKKPAISVTPKAEVSSKRTSNPAPAAKPTDTAAPPNSDWEFYHAGDSKKTEDHLKPVASSPVPAASRKVTPAIVKTTAPPKTAGSSTKTPSTPRISGGASTLQGSARTRQAGARQ